MAVDLIESVLLGVDGSPPVRTTQFQNVGRIRNTGWEFQGRLTAGRLSLAGTYSITSSLIRQLSPTYTGDLRLGDPLIGIPKHTAGATLGYSSGGTAATLGMTYVGSWTESDYRALFGFFSGGQPYRGSGRAYWVAYPSFTKLNLTISQAVTDRLSVFLQSDHLTNKTIVERSNLFFHPGRLTTFGVRTKF